MKRYFVFMLICLMLLTAGIVKSHELDSRLVGKVIVLDAGHGGKDKGSSSGNVYESDINLSLVIKLKKELNKHGVDVILTRDLHRTINRTVTSSAKSAYSSQSTSGGSYSSGGGSFSSGSGGGGGFSSGGGGGGGGGGVGRF